MRETLPYPTLIFDTSNRTEAPKALSQMALETFITCKVDEHIRKTFPMCFKSKKRLAPAQSPAFGTRSKDRPLPVHIWKNNTTDKNYDLPSAVRNVRRSGRLQGHEPEILANLSALQSELGIDNTIIPGYTTMFAENLTKYDMYSN